MEEITLTETEKQIIAVQKQLEKDRVIKAQLPDDVYFGLPDMLGSSTLKKLTITPAHYKNPKPYAQDNYNKCIHLAMLEPEKFKDIVLVKDLRSADNKKIKENAELDGLICMTLPKYNAVVEVCKAHANNPVIKKYLNHCEKEISYMTFDNVYKNIKMRMKADIISHEKKVIIDLKNMGSPAGGLTDNECYRRAKENGWFFQAALYLRIIKIIFGEDYIFRFLLIEDKPPYGFREFEVQQELIDYYSMLLDKNLIILDRCYEDKHFPCYNNEADYFDVPEWDMKRITQEENQEA